MHSILLGVSKNWGTPKWMVKIMEHPIKMDDLEVSPFKVSILFSWLECTSVAPLPTLHPYLFFWSRWHGQRCGSDMESKTGDSYFSSWFCHGPTVKQTASSVGYIRGGGSWFLKETMHQFSYRRSFHITTVISLAGQNPSNDLRFMLTIFFASFLDQHWCSFCLLPEFTDLLSF